ncbi:MAG: glycosyltransferase [Candidatus Zixiibacteriota bacterium]|nr:MAG: glycosyltransferase [candidate division Zixibacteria bacterium]
MDISVIIPTRDGNATLGRCLASLKRSTHPPHEVIVVDDCSKEDVSSIVESFGFRTIRLDEPREAEYARNKGAELATGDILVFTDSDMLLQPDVLKRINDHLSKNRYAAVSGVCTPETDDKKLAARYKNLWLYYSYVNSPHDFDWFILSIGAVRKEVFSELKGFKTDYLTVSGGGDLEFGRRLKEAGKKIRLDTAIQGRHLKRYTIRSLLRNDYVRGKGWFEFAAGKKVLWHVIRRFRIGNIYPAFIVSVLISFSLLFLLLLAPFHSILVYLAILSALAHLLINYPLFRFFKREAGVGFLLKAIPLTFIDHLAAGFGVISGCISWVSSLLTRRILRPKSKGRFAQEMTGS